MPRMQEAQILYAVTGIVVLALAAWTARALLTAPHEAALRGRPPPRGDDEASIVPEALTLVTAVGRSDRGKERATNRDACLILEKERVLAIADGMGRHAAGDIASKLAIEAIERAFTNGKGEKGARGLQDAIGLANTSVWEKAQEAREYAGMGTTVVVACFSPNEQKVYLAHVGDGRCYRLRGGELIQLTQDHTLGTLGTEPTVQVDVMTESHKPGDVYLLCSDALARVVDTPKITATLSETEDLASATAKLVALAKTEGGTDDVSAILARVAAPAGPT
jgi:protein phosphatase